MLLLYISLMLIDCHPKSGNNAATDSGKKIYNVINSDTSLNAKLNMKQKDKNTSVDSIPFDLAYIMGKFDPTTHADFQKIPIAYADQENRYLRKDALAAFINMYNHAKKDGIELKIISATRNFANQKSIWERKWNGQTTLENGVKGTDIKDEKKRALKILEYSSMPGTSRHHWGTDIDINDLTNEYFDHGTGKKIYDWLSKHALDYGYVQVYTAGRPHGYKEERWHWSYKPISAQLTTLAKTKLHDTMIDGFDGAATAKEIGIVEKYILGINKACF